MGLELYALVNDVPTLVASAINQPIGAAESLVDLNLMTPGEYYVRIAGSGSLTQLYQLAIGVESLAALDGDFDLDGDVDGTDFLDWQQGFGNGFDADDLVLWQVNFGVVGQESSSSAVIPEPAAWVLAAAAMGGVPGRARRNRVVRN